MYDINDVASAIGLMDEDKALLRQLCAVFMRNRGRNALKVEYYEDLNPVKNLGLAVPEQFLRTIDTSVGWCAKAVDFLGCRSRFDGFIVHESVQDVMDRIVSSNDFGLLYQMLLTPELQHGHGYLTVSKGDSWQPAVINFRDAETAAGIWDYRHKRIKACMVIEDWKPITNSSMEMEPCLMVMHTDKFVITIEKVQRHWYAKYHEHGMGRPMAEPICYRPTYKKPFGKSRISRTCMAITDEMQREIVRTALHSECFSAPQKYALGAPDEMFDIEKFKMAYNSFMLVSKDVDGDVPQLGQFAQASMEPHIKAMELLMSRMAAETHIPVAAFGLTSNGYTSSDALRASTDDLIVEAESLNESNGKALANVARMALAVSLNKKLTELTPDEAHIIVKFADPSKPSISSRADAMVKIASVAEGFHNTDVFWEQIGMDEDERRRIRADLREAAASNALNALFTGADEVSYENPESMD